MKIERTQIHFLSNVVPSSPSSDLKVPNGKGLYSNPINRGPIYIEGGCLRSDSTEEVFI